MEHKHSVYDTDARFSINPITRAIKDESSSRTTLVQYDHNSERFSFEIPRYVEGHDMSLCNLVQIHFINIDAKTKAENADVYAVDDMQVNPDKEDSVVLSWLISRNATLYAGTLSFILRFACIGDDGKIEYAWNTAKYTGIPVSDGINNTEIIIEEYSDIISQWEARINAVEYGITAIEKAMVKSVNGNTPDENGNVQIETGGGGTSIDVTAQVGQTIVVKEVDANGKPTAWESADYQPRTHWSEHVEVLPETTVEIDPEAGIGLLPDMAIEGRKEYTVIYNGVVHTGCVCQDYDENLLIGNGGAIVETLPVTNHPFIIGTQELDVDESGNPIIGWMCAPLDGSTSVTLSIIENVNHTIPEKYIPKPYVYEIDDEQFELSGTDKDGHYVASIAECPVSLLKAMMDGSPVFVKKYNTINEYMVRETIQPATWACTAVNTLSNFIESVEGEYIPSKEIDVLSPALYFRGERAIESIYTYVIRFIGEAE